MNKELSKMLTSIIEEIERLGYRYTTEGEIIDSKNSKVSNVIIIPKYQIRIEETNEIYAVISAVIDGSKFVENIKLPAAELATVKWIPSYLGLGAIVYPRKKQEFTLIMKNLFRNVQSKTTFSSTGWIKDNENKYEYIDYSGGIENTTVDVCLEEHLSKYSISREEVNVINAAKESHNILKVVDRKISYTLLGLTYLCPLLEFIGERLKLPEFTVWMYGFTGTRKTTLAKLMLAHFGDFQNGVPASFNDTYSSIEIRAHALKDTLILLDDFCPQQSYKETQNINTTAEKVIRAFGDRTSRGRSTVTLENQKKFIPRGMMLITGETIVPGNSTVARLITLELKKDSINLKELSEVQKNSKLLSVSMREYIKWIKKEVNSDYTNFLDTIECNYNVYLEDIRENAVNTDGRSYEAYAFLLLGLDMMYQFFESIGLLTEEEAKIEFEEAKIEFIDQIKINHENSKSNDPVELFLDTIKELITTKEITLRDLDNGVITGNKYKGINGYYDSEYFYFSSNDVYGIVRHKLQKSGEYLQLPIRALLKVLADRGIIKVEDKTNLPKKTIIDDDGRVSRSRMLHIKREFLE